MAQPDAFLQPEAPRVLWLDDFLPGKAVVSPAIRVSRPAIIRVLGRGGHPVRIDLRHLEACLTRAAARSEYDNY